MNHHSHGQNHAAAQEGPAAWRKGDALRHTLDAVDYGALLLDRGLCVIHANRTARSRLEPLGLSLVQGRPLQLACPVEFARMGRAVQRAVELRTRALLRLGGVLAGVMPASQHDDLPWVTVLLERPAMCSPFALAAYGREHDLTPAEAAVLQRIGCGDAPGHIAAHFGVSLNTVRTQISSIRAKVGVASMRELIGRLACLPPLIGVVEEVP